MLKNITYKICSLMIIGVLILTSCSNTDNRTNNKITTQKATKVDNINEFEYEKILRSSNSSVAYFLITGVDLSENLTDIILLACFDYKKDKLKVLQIPRDTFVGDVPTGKINAVYGNPRENESKIEALIRCINLKFRLPVDYYIRLNIKASEQIINSIGGVDIKLDRSFTLVDDSRKPGQQKTFSAGKVHLDGQWATAFLRHRKSFSQGDLGRIKNQRSVYAAIFNKFRYISNEEMSSIISNSINYVETDIKINTAVSLAYKIKKLSTKDITIYTLPGQVATVNNISCWVCHKQETVDLINKYFMPYEENLLTVDDLSIKDYTEIGANYDNSYGSFLEGGELEKFDKDQN